MDILLNIAIFLLTIFVLILVHELGHFMVARALGIKVERFSIGFGKPILLKRSKSGIEYGLAPILLGGYVKLNEESYQQQPVCKRMAVMVAGVMANILLALVVFWLLFIIGFTTPKPIVGRVVASSIAAKSGLKSGTLIREVDKRQIDDWRGVALAVMSRIGDRGELLVNHYRLSLGNWKVNELNPDPLASLGIIPYQPTGHWPENKLQKIKYTPLPAIAAAWQQTWNMLTFNAVILVKLLTGKISLRALGGPLTIFSATEVAFSAGIIAFFGFLAVLSIMLAFVNILPIPGLDGGNLVFLVLEAVIGKPVSIKVQMFALRMGMLILACIVFIALGNDLWRLFN